jgi:tyrosyl-tRNA synthetase
MLEKEAFTVYAGFDPTADSLHLGSMVPLLGLARFQRAGHTPIALMGGGTGMIGDPSGKSEERNLLTADVIEANVAGIEVQMRHFLDFAGSNAAIMENNLDWLGKLDLISFLRDVGKHFSVNVMMAKESVRTRLEDRDTGMSYTEFSYQLLQAYDFLELFDRHGCRLQIGGSDQWGNIVAGMDLTRRLREGVSTFGLTMPLITKADGSKFGKTESGTVWLDPKRTSPYKFYQYWLNTSDADVVRYLAFFTFMDRSDVDHLAVQVDDAPHERAAQKRLAEEITRMVHGETALQDAIKASQAMFGGDLKGLDEATLSDVFSEVPSSDLPKSDLAGETTLLDTLVNAGVFKSKGEARRMIKDGGVYLNNERVTDEGAVLSDASLCTGNIAVVRKGKKNYHLLRFG